jgi:cytochrome b subunit of formate dehydrogenase
MRKTGWSGWGDLAAAAAVAAALALGAVAAAAAPSNDDCMMCHGSKDLVRESGKGSLWVDPSQLKGSAHDGKQCVDCHRGLSELPHASKLPKVRCADCHGDVARGMVKGVHNRVTGSTGESCSGCHGTHDVKPARALGGGSCASCHEDITAEYLSSAHADGRAHGDSDAATCQDCHGSIHEVLPGGSPDSPVNHANLAKTCARCHADKDLVERRKIPIRTAVELYSQSVHGRSDSTSAATCNDCHGAHAIKRSIDPTSSIHQSNVAATCGRCHGREAEAFNISIHGQAVAAGNRHSPTCTDCHGEHLIRGPHQSGSPVAGAAVNATCSSCHEATGIRETFGLPAGRLSSFEDSFHGLAARGGSPVVANCASCHGYHDVLPSRDERSAIAPGNLQQTCGKCHPGTSVEFAQGSIHTTFATLDDPILKFVRNLYLWLIGLTIGGMAFHQGLHFLKQMRARFRQAVDPHPHPHLPSGRTHLRMTGSERFQHLVLLVTFFTLVYTGFALKFPENFLFSWFARLESGYQLRSLIHRIAAIGMVAISLFHVGYLLTRRGRRLAIDMLPTPRDAVQVVENFAYLLGLRKHPPRFERFGYIEKAEYLALVWGTVVMTITGFVLWFENDFGRMGLSKFWFDLSTIVHYYEAWLAFLAIVVWHLYQNIVNPEVYPVNWTFITGRISDELLHHEHAAEWERVREEEARLAEQARRAGEATGGEPARDA